MIGRTLAALATRRGIFNLVSLAFLIALLWGISKTQPWDWPLIAGAIVAAALAPLVGNFEQIEFFKASATGIEARTRAVVERAESAVSELHTLAALTGAMLVTLLAGEGRWGGMDRTNKERQKADLLANLKALGLSDAALDKVGTADRDYVIVDYVDHIMQRTDKIVPRTNVRDPKVREFVYQFGEFKRPDAETLHSHLQKHFELDPVTLEWIEDYRYYLARSKHRRPEKWCSPESIDE
ncbi:MAG TPA: hypothetical protein VFE34_15495 [Dongiaceae bacterium]|jgi:hypothetical protein|nr:hypothetical protein [Dongiaceae bacterium]